MSDRTYDQFGHRFMVSVGPHSVAIDGTASALAAEADTMVPLPFACKLVGGSRINETGATDAVALVSAVVCRSTAGTGSLSAAGTFVWNGTCATGAVGSAITVGTGTSADFAAGDYVCISEAVGTIAAISTHGFTLAFEELFN